MGEEGKGVCNNPNFWSQLFKTRFAFYPSTMQWGDISLLNEVFGTPPKIGVVGDCLTGFPKLLQVILTKFLLPPRQGCTNLSCSSSSALRCPLRWTLGEIRELVKNCLADFFAKGVSAPSSLLALMSLQKWGTLAPLSL